MKTYLKCVYASNRSHILSTVEVDQLYLFTERGFYLGDNNMIPWRDLSIFGSVDWYLGTTIKIDCCDFVVEWDQETYAKIKENLREYDIDYNPFEYMLYYSMELTRDLLFASHRYRNPIFPEGICTNEDRLKKTFEQVMDKFHILEELSEETVRFLRETSTSTLREYHDGLNTSLLKYERELPTKMSHWSPVRSDIFERVLYGETSGEYIRLRELKKLTKELSDQSWSKGDLYSALVTFDKYSVETNLTKEEYDKYKKLVQEYRLSRDEIHYMINVLESRKE